MCALTFRTSNSDVARQATSELTSCPRRDFLEQVHRPVLDDVEVRHDSAGDRLAVRHQETPVLRDVVTADRGRTAVPGQEQRLWLSRRKPRPARDRHRRDRVAPEGREVRHQVYNVRPSRAHSGSRPPFVEIGASFPGQGTVGRRPAAARTRPIHTRAIARQATTPARCPRSASVPEASRARSSAHESAPRCPTVCPGRPARTRACCRPASSLQAFATVRPNAADLWARLSSREWNPEQVRWPPRRPRNGETASVWRPDGKCVMPPKSHARARAVGRLVDPHVLVLRRVQHERDSLAVGRQTRREVRPWRCSDWRFASLGVHPDEPPIDSRIDGRRGRRRASRCVKWRPARRPCLASSRPPESRA